MWLNFALPSTKASVSSLLGQLSVPFTFIDYFLKGVTRFLVDYHLLEDAFSFEDGDKIVKISLAAYGTWSPAPWRTRTRHRHLVQFKIQRWRELSCADFPLALALTHCHTPLRVCRLRRQELQGNLPLTLATSISLLDSTS